MSNEKHSAISCDRATIKAFQHYVKARGFSVGKALEYALNDFINGGADRMIEEFKNVKPETFKEI